MCPSPIDSDLAEAVQNLQRHSLAQLPGSVSKLIFLASTRDYNTGRYYHDGLASQFSEKIAAQALAACHQDVFSELVYSPLDNLVRELDAYFASLPAKRKELLAAWKKLEPYRVIVPAAADSLSSQLFYSNIKIALAILSSHQNAGPGAEPGASPPLLLAQ
jgi:hypothetical protein